MIAWSGIRYIQWYMKYVRWFKSHRSDGRKLHHKLILSINWMMSVEYEQLSEGMLCVALLTGEKSTGKPDLTDKWTESNNNVIMAWKLVRSFNVTPFTIRTSLISQGGFVVELRVKTANRHSGVGFTSVNYASLRPKRNSTYAPLQTEYTLGFRKSHALFKIQIHLQVLIPRSVW